MAGCVCAVCVLRVCPVCAPIPFTFQVQQGLSRGHGRGSFSVAHTLSCIKQLFHAVSLIVDVHRRCANRHYAYSATSENTESGHLGFHRKNLNRQPPTCRSDSLQCQALTVPFRRSTNQCTSTVVAVDQYKYAIRTRGQALTLQT